MHEIEKLIKDNYCEDVWTKNLKVKIKNELDALFN